MAGTTSIHEAYDRVLERAAVLFDEQRDRVYKQTDRLFAWLLLAQWVAAICTALWISPTSWKGVDDHVQTHVTSALFFGAAIVAVPVFFAFKRSGRPLTRHVIAVAQMLMSGLLIQLTAGRPETHFHVFGSLAFLAFYRDWRVLITASLVIAGDHLLRGIYWPQSVFGTASASPWRTLEHAGWVTFEDIFLVRSIFRSSSELWETCQRQAELEASNLIVEAKVDEQTSELRVTEERFRLLSSASPIGIVLTDSSGKCLYTNNRWGEISGMPAELNNEYGWLKSLHPDDRQAVIAHWTSATERLTEFVKDFRLLHSSGELIWVHARATSIGMHNGTARGYVWTIEDINERKHAESRLALQYAISAALSEAIDLIDAAPRLLQGISEHAGWQVGALWVRDSDGTRLKLAGVWQQPGALPTDYEAVCRKLDLDSGRGALGRVWSEQQPLFADASPQFVEDDRAALFAQNRMKGYYVFPVVEGNEMEALLEFVSRENKVPDHEGLLLMQSIGSQVAQFAVRMSAELRLRDSDARVRAMLESAVDGVITFDRDGIIDTVNPGFERILGFDVDDVLGKEIAHFLPVDESLGLSDNLSFLLKSIRADIQDHGYSDRELMVSRKKGTQVPVEFRVIEVVLGTKNFYSGIVRDITERKEVEKRVSEFYSTVSHELRTPLTSIRGALGLIEGGVVGQIGAEVQELVTIARSSCDRLIRLINDILDLRKIEAGKLDMKLSHIIASEVTKESLDGIKGMADEFGINLACAIEGDATINGDRDRVTQVITNLVSNAIKFSHPGGLVEVKVTSGGSAVRFSIKDHGPGIPADQRHKLFQKFSQLDSSDTRAQGGTGLGLAISKAIVDRHGGQIGVDSVPGEGSTFWFDVPVAAATAARDGEPERVFAATGKGGSDGATAGGDGRTSTATGDQSNSILIVEDEDEHFRILQILLSGKNFRLEHAKTVADGRSALQKQAFDLVVLDPGLPDGDGMELIALVASPLILYTGRELDAAFQQSLPHSVKYLPKDTTVPELFRQAVQDLLAQKKYSKSCLHEVST